jgi:hypothetical protein
VLDVLDAVHSAQHAVLGRGSKSKSAQPRVLADLHAGKTLNHAVIAPVNERNFP